MKEVKGTMDKVLVTGATGFIGREVLSQLRAQGKQVTALGRTPPEDKDVPFIKADLTDAVSLEQALGTASFNFIIHTASLPGDTGDPQQMVRVNLNGCHNLLEYARKARVGRFVLTSSISAYEWYPATRFNPPDYMPVDEDHLCRPKDMYSTTKRMQELLALTYHHQYGVPATALRLTAVIGPRGKGGGRGWLSFAQKLDEARSVQVPHFSAQELCHYVDLRDVGRMHLAAAEHPSAVGEIFNCCGPGPTRGNEFAEVLRQLVPGIEVEYDFPWSMAQGGELVFSMSKAKKLIDFEPIHSFADSVKSIKDWVDAGGLGREAAPRNESYTGGIGKMGEN